MPEGISSSGGGRSESFRGGFQSKAGDRRGEYGQSGTEVLLLVFSHSMELCDIFFLLFWEGRTDSYWMQLSWDEFPVC